jgi:hypothetical protein
MDNIKEKNRKRALAWYHKNRNKCLEKQKIWRESKSGKEWRAKWASEYTNSGKAAKACRKSYWKNPERAREKGRRNYQKNREEILKKMLLWQKSEPGKKWRENWNKKHKKIRLVMYATRNAVRRGDIEIKPCSICGAKAEKHHPDYGKPLEVEFLCKKHHAELHRMQRTFYKQNLKKETNVIHDRKCT